MRAIGFFLGLALAPLQAMGAPAGQVPAGQAPAGEAPALFTAAQASTGAVMYGQACAGCHGADLQGITGPPLAGQQFATREDGFTVGLVFNNIWEGTPAGAPDSLSKTEYVAIMAYIMARNGLPAGDVALTYDGARESKAPFYALVR